MIAAMLAAVAIAFPKDGAELPNISNCYLIGATDGGETNLPVRVGGFASSTRVWSTGAWGTVVPVAVGTNVVEVGGCRRTFVVAPPKPPVPAKTYTKLEYAGDKAKPHPKGRKPGEITVVLDAGHGGHDDGALSPHALPEKDANLRMAKDVSRWLKKRGYRVVMTREDDTFVELYDRPKVAHAQNADAFVSIHHNAPGFSMDPTACRDQSVYAWNPLGEALARAIVARMAIAAPKVPSKGVLHANFAVTRNPEIPSCLVEVDFVTHPDGESAIWCPSRRDKTAEAIAAGIDDWVRKEIPTGRKGK